MKPMVHQNGKTASINIAIPTTYSINHAKTIIKDYNLENVLRTYYRDNCNVLSFKATYHSKNQVEFPVSKAILNKLDAAYPALQLDSNTLGLDKIILRPGTYTISGAMYEDDALEEAFGEHRSTDQHVVVEAHEAESVFVQPIKPPSPLQLITKVETPQATMASGAQNGTPVVKTYSTDPNVAAPIIGTPYTPQGAPAPQPTKAAPGPVALKAPVAMPVVTPIIANDVDAPIDNIMQVVYRAPEQDTLTQNSTPAPEEEPSVHIRKTQIQHNLMSIEDPVLQARGSTQAVPQQLSKGEQFAQIIKQMQEGLEKLLYLSEDATDSSNKEEVQDYLNDLNPTIVRIGELGHALDLDHHHSA